MAVVQLARSVATDPGFLKDLAKEINVRLQKADDHRLSAALKLAEAKYACKKAGVPFKSWVAREIKQIGYFEATRLAKIGIAPEPAKALADMRAGGAARESARRDRVASRDATPATALSSAVTLPRPRDKEGTCTHVKDVVIALSAMPEAATVVGYFKDNAFATVIDERLASATQWLNEFAVAWAAANNGDDNA